MLAGYFILRFTLPIFVSVSGAVWNVVVLAQKVFVRDCVSCLSLLRAICNRSLCGGCGRGVSHLSIPRDAFRGHACSSRIAFCTVRARAG